MKTAVVIVIWRANHSVDVTECDFVCAPKNTGKVDHGQKRNPARSAAKKLPGQMVHLASALLPLWTSLQAATYEGMAIGWLSDAIGCV